eukprot:2112363-Amphidinium_carterae.3
MQCRVDDHVVRKNWKRVLFRFPPFAITQQLQHLISNAPHGSFMADVCVSLHDVFRHFVFVTEAHMSLGTRDVCDLNQRQRVHHVSPSVMPSQ